MEDTAAYMAHVDTLPADQLLGQLQQLTVEMVQFRAKPKRHELLDAKREYVRVVILSRMA